MISCGMSAMGKRMYSASFKSMLSRGCSHIAIILYVITTAGEAGAMCFLFLWAYVTDNSSICDCFVMRDLCAFDK
eukprot:1592125-Ditylum_brightwellii.AAC.1